MLRITHASLVIGVILAGIVITIVTGGLPDRLQVEWNILTLTFLGLGGLAGVAGVTAPRRIVAQGLTAIPRDNPEAALLPLYYISRLVGWSLLEGGAFMQLVFQFIERQPVLLVLAAILTAILATQYPSQAKIEEWIDEHKREIWRSR